MRSPQTGRGGEDARSPKGGGAGGEEGKTIEAGEGGSPEAVGNPPLDLPPMNIHFGEEPFGGDEEVGAI